MHSYYRLTYASTTTSKPSGIRQDLINILNEAEDHNASHNIYGVLFYGSDYFFQCLEGEKIQIDQLYEKILKDPRHKNIVLLSYQVIEQPRFINWNLKYVLQEPSILEFFQSNQWEKFNPYALDQDLIDPFLNILADHNENTPGEHEEVIGQESMQGNVLNYKYVLFIILVMAALIGVYFLSGYSASPQGYGMPVQ